MKKNESRVGKLHILPAAVKVVVGLGLKSWNPMAIDSKADLIDIIQYIK